MGTGTGSFGSATKFLTSGSPKTIKFGDMNGDSALDVVVATSSNGINILFNDGSGALGNRADYYSGSTGTYGIALSDMNGDLKLDPISSNVNSSNITLYYFDPTLQTVKSSLSVIPANSSTLGMIVQGVSGQTQDYVRLQDAYGVSPFRVDKDGKVQLGQALNLDGSIAFNSSSRSYKTTLTATAPTADRSIVLPNESGTICLQNSSCGYASSSGSGSYIQNQTASSQSASYRISGTGRADTALQSPLLDTPTAVALAIGTTNATVINLNQNVVIANGKTLTLNGHIITAGTAPTIAAGAAACTTPTVSVVGNDTTGVITVTTGTGCAAGGELGTVTFNSAYGAAPRITLTPATDTAAALPTYIDDATISITTFKLNTPAATVPVDSTTYKWYYHVIQ